MMTMDVPSVGNQTWTVQTPSPDAYFYLLGWLQREITDDDDASCAERERSTREGTRAERFHAVHTAPSSMGKYMRSAMKASISPGLG